MYVLQYLQVFRRGLYNASIRAAAINSDLEL